MTYGELRTMIADAFGLRIPDSEFFDSFRLKIVVGDIAAHEAAFELFRNHLSRFTKNEKGLGDVVCWLERLHGSAPVGDLPQLLRQYRVSRI